MSTKQLPQSLHKLKPVLREQDWAYEPTSKGHIAILDASGRTVTRAAGTASDWRGSKNMLAILKPALYSRPDSNSTKEYGVSRHVLPENRTCWLCWQA